MSRDLDPRSHDRDIDTPDIGRGGRLHDDPRDVERTDPRDVFARAVDLPRGPGRERIEFRDRAYDLRGSEVRILTTIGAFRAVSASDLEDRHGRGSVARAGDLHRLRSQGLIRTVAPTINGRRTALVTLTRRGHQLLEAYRSKGSEQAFHHGITRERDLGHDGHLYRAYLRAAERLAERGADVHRVQIEVDLKREYQRFLQAANVNRPDSDGRPTQGRDAVQAWAEAHELPLIDGRLQFPDIRLEYHEPDGRRGIEDLEVTTIHYRGAHAAAKAQAGFSRYRVGTARVGGSARSGGRPFDPRVAEEWLS